MGELIKLPGAVIEGEAPVPSQPIIEYLESVLEKAKTGQAQSLALVWVDGETDIAYHALHLADPICLNALVAGTSYLWHRAVTEASMVTTAAEDPPSEPDDEGPRGTGDGL